MLGAQRTIIAIRGRTGHANRLTGLARPGDVLALLVANAARAGFRHEKLIPSD